MEALPGWEDEPPEVVAGVLLSDGILVVVDGFERDFVKTDLGSNSRG